MSGFAPFVEVGRGFFNLRGSFKVALGLADIGTHMSVIRLRSGKFLVVDTCAISGSVKEAFDKLTSNGTLIEAVVATHPFHTVFFSPFFQQYPNAKYYGTPRHLRNNTAIPWAGDVSDEAVRNQWLSEGVQMRIPDGADFVNPAEDNHFSGMFVFHEDSKTIHIDDTVMYFEDPGFVLRLAGVRAGKMSFHPSTFKNGLNQQPEAPAQFVQWVEKLLTDWDFDNICTAHSSNKIGGAKDMLRTTLEHNRPKFEALAQRLAKKK